MIILNNDYNLYIFKDEYAIILAFLVFYVIPIGKSRHYFIVAMELQTIYILYYKIQNF